MLRFVRFQKAKIQIVLQNKYIRRINALFRRNAQDFIQFKASILFEDSKNDPIKKAETIRDIVNSIAKIPDRIKKEIYIQECARIMDISEGVVFYT